MKRLLASLISTTLISFLLLTSTTTSANDVTDTVSINVPASCSLTSTVDSTHSATVANGVYKEGIGTTTFSVFCNDNDGFGIYAIGYSNDTHGNNEMLSQNSNITRNIVTGTATSGNTSNWAMKLTPVTGTITPTIDNGYDNYNVVPDVYTRVASFTSITNNLATSKFQSTYSVYAAGDQPAGTYIGKVKYTITHPASVDPSAGQANLDTGANINMKLKSLASGTDVTNTNTTDNLITAFVRSDTLPANFTPSTANTISLSNSLTPVYVWFDSNDGTMYYYSKAKDVYINMGSRYLFYSMESLADFSGLKYFIADNAMDMGYMFGYTQISDLTPIKDWNVSNVRDMEDMFRSTQISDLTPITNWKVDNVMYMNYMFESTGISDLTPLTNWKVDNVTNMNSMFRSTQISNLTPLANWKVDNVRDMNSVFSGCTLLTDISGLEKWDTSKVSSISWMFANTSISDFTPIAKWDISKITDMSCLFQNNKALTDLTAFAQWDISGVTNIQQMFYGSGISDLAPIANWNISSVTSMHSTFSNTQISDLAPLANWNTSNVTTMQNLFKQTQISDLTPIKDWNVENVTNLSGMFDSIPTLVNSSPISGWDVGKVEHTGEANKGFYQMFGRSTPKTNLPIFTSRPGTWNPLGTYIPNS